MTSTKSTFWRSSRRWKIRTRKETWETTATALFSMRPPNYMKNTNSQMGASLTGGHGRRIQSCSSTGRNTLPHCRTTLMEIVGVWDSLRTWRRSLEWSLLTKNTNVVESVSLIEFKGLLLLPTEVFGASCGQEFGMENAWSSYHTLYSNCKT